MSKSFKEKMLEELEKRFDAFFEDKGDLLDTKENFKYFFLTVIDQTRANTIRELDKKYNSLCEKKVKETRIQTLNEVEERLLADCNDEYAIRILRLTIKEMKK